MGCGIPDHGETTIIMVHGGGGPRLGLASASRRRWSRISSCSITAVAWRTITTAAGGALRLYAAGAGNGGPPSDSVFKEPATRRFAWAWARRSLPFVFVFAALPLLLVVGRAFTLDRNSQSPSPVAFSAYTFLSAAPCRIICSLRIATLGNAVWCAEQRPVGHGGAQSHRQRLNRHGGWLGPGVVLRHLPANGNQ